MVDKSVIYLRVSKKEQDEKNPLKSKKGLKTYVSNGIPPRSGYGPAEI